MTVYQFQQAENGDLWAIPVEPVHPNTRGMFIHANALGGWGATPSDTCWVALPFDADFNNRIWFYRDGSTGLCYTAHVVEVLDAAVGPDKMALKPVPVPMEEPVQPDFSAMKLWESEIYDANQPPQEMNLGARVANKIIGGEPIDGLQPEDIIECSDGSGRTCYMLPPSPMYDTWNDNRRICDPSFREDE